MYILSIILRANMHFEASAQLVGVHKRKYMRFTSSAVAHTQTAHSACRGPISVLVSTTMSANLVGSQDSDAG